MGLRRPLAVALISTLLAGSMRSADAQTARGTIAPLAALTGSTLTIRGSTTIGAHWNCTAKDITASAGMFAGELAFTPDAVHSVSVNVLVSDLRCQSARMDRAMLKAMHADTDSTSAIVGNFKLQPAYGPNNVGGAHLDGTLIVAGTARGVVLDLSAERMSDSVVRVRSTVPLALSGFNIVPPRVLFGAIRARDSITVEVDLRFASKPPQ